MAEDNVTCAICFRIFYDPISTPCNHTYCRGCLSAAVNKNSTTCPLCRQPLAPWDPVSAPSNSTLKAFIKGGELRGQYELRKAEHKTEQALAAAIKYVKISIGNLHQLVATNGQNCHKWTFFLLAHDGSDLTQYISRVLVHLHPTFNPSTVVMSDEPYMFSRVGWGVFTIKVSVEYHAYLQKPADTFTHMLSFQANGNAASHELEINSRNIPQDIENNNIEDAA